MISLLIKMTSNKQWNHVAERGFPYSPSVVEKSSVWRTLGATIFHSPVRFHYGQLPDCAWTSKSIGQLIL